MFVLSMVLGSFMYGLDCGHALLARSSRLLWPHLYANHERAAISHHRKQTMTLQSQYCTRCGMVGHEASDCPMLPKARRRKPRPIFLPCDRCVAQLHHILANSCIASSPSLAPV